MGSDDDWLRKVCAWGIRALGMEATPLEVERILAQYRPDREGADPPSEAAPASSSQPPST